jgi:hypothetical protein
MCPPVCERKRVVKMSAGRLLRPGPLDPPRAIVYPPWLFGFWGNHKPGARPKQGRWREMRPPAAPPPLPALQPSRRSRFSGWLRWPEPTPSNRGQSGGWLGRLHGAQPEWRERVRLHQSRRCVPASSVASRNWRTFWWRSIFAMASTAAAGVGRRPDSLNGSPPPVQTPRGGALRLGRDRPSWCRHEGRP